MIAASEEPADFHFELALKGQVPKNPTRCSGLFQPKPKLGPVEVST